MKKLLSKIKNWLKHNYLALILVGCILLLFVGRFNFTTNLSTDNKWKSVLRGYALNVVGSDGVEMMGYTQLATIFDVPYTDNYSLLISECVNKLKKYDKDLYKSLDNYTIENKGPLLEWNLITVGKESYQILDSDNKDHFKEYIKKINSFNNKTENKGETNESK